MRKKGKRFVAILCIALCFCLSAGCAPESSESGFVPEAPEDYFEQFDAGILNWKDNSLDAYSAQFICVLEPTESEDCFNGGGSLVMGTHRITKMQKHLGLEDPLKSWDELLFVTDQQESGNVRLAFPFTPDSINQAWTMGAVYGSDHYICVNIEASPQDGTLYHFFEVTEDLEVVNDFYADFLDEFEFDHVDDLYKDASGNIHIFVENAGDPFLTYHITNALGELRGTHVLWKEGEDSRQYIDFSPCPLYDGRMAVSAPYFGESRLKTKTDTFLMDPITGEKEMLISQENYQGDEVLCSTLWDESTILYATGIGIYLCDLSWENARLLYQWSNHGLSVSGARVQPCEKEGIAVCCWNSEETCGLFLEPTKEEVPIRQITFAVPKNRVRAYEKIVQTFNRKYPAYHVELKSDYDQTLLLTEIIAGEGPVLVDSALTGFEELSNLWEPLDGMLEATGLTGELNAKALECGKIDSVTYGVTNDFALLTVLTLDRAVKAEDWTYEEFLDYVETHPSAKAVFPPVPLNRSGNTLIFSYLMHGLEDNYLLDPGNKGNCLNADRLERVLGLAQKYCSDQEPLEPGALSTGEALFIGKSILGVGSILADRRTFGEERFYVGYPTEDGGKHFLSGSDPVAVRKTASNEDKKAAFTFLRELLSYAGQKALSTDANYHISIRKDIMEEQLEEEIRSLLSQETEVDGIRTEKQREQMDREKAFFLELLEKAVPEPRLPSELEDILWTEFSDYFDGKITKDLLTDHLRNRVQLYFNETE